MFNSENNKLVLIVFIVCLIFFFIIMPYVNQNLYDEQKEVYENFDNIIYQTIQNNQKDDIDRFDTKICSKQCCKYDVWPVPFNTTNPNVDPKILDKFVGTNITCANGEVTGCICATKSDMEYLSNHGQ
jgi:hypothetical protein